MNIFAYGKGMQYYPLLVNMRGARCLIVGAGEVGCRKLTDLLASDLAEVLVLDVAAPAPAMQILLKDSRVQFEQRSFTFEDIKGRLLVFAATGNHELNSIVVSSCADAGILCNCVDAPDKSGFIVPARIYEGRVTMTLSTQGGSPALARRMRQELAPQIRDMYAPLAELMARLRPMILEEGRKTQLNTELFRKIVYSQLGEALGKRDTITCNALLRDMLPTSLHDRISELLYGLV